MTVLPTIGQAGKVYLVGAGPGDPELLTLKAARILGLADVVLTDRLVDSSIVQRHAPQAVVIPVGKQCRKKQSTPQPTINELMVQHALAGRTVVRLKGGDVSLFSNVLDELQALEEHGLAYELVPGITAAMGVAAAAGVPLTARGYSLGVHLITCYQPHAVTQHEWSFYAGTSNTLVFYMSGEILEHVQQQLLLYGMAPDMPVLLAEQATTPGQRFRLSSLAQCVSDWSAGDILSPALLMIGRNAALHQRFAWDQQQEQPETWFAPVARSADPPTLRHPETAIPFITK